MALVVSFSCFEAAPQPIEEPADALNQLRLVVSFSCFTINDPRGMDMDSLEGRYLVVSFSCFNTFGGRLAPCFAAATGVL